jgi:hypothetical protein
VKREGGGNQAVEQAVYDAANEGHACSVRAVPGLTVAGFQLPDDAIFSVEHFHCADASVAANVRSQALRTRRGRPDPADVKRY